MNMLMSKGHLQPFQSAPVSIICKTIKSVVATLSFFLYSRLNRLHPLATNCQTGYFCKRDFLLFRFHPMFCLKRLAQNGFLKHFAIIYRIELTDMLQDRKLCQSESVQNHCKSVDKSCTDSTTPHIALPVEEAGEPTDSSKPYSKIGVWLS